MSERWWRHFDEPRPVRVLHDDGRWYDGMATDWTRSEAGWRCHVRYTVTPGSTFLRAVDPDWVQPVDG